MSIRGVIAVASIAASFAAPTANAQERLSTAPPSDGLVPGQSWSVVGAGYTCQDAQPDDPRNLTLYRQYRVRDCRREPNDMRLLYFIRDTLVAIINPVSVRSLESLFPADGASRPTAIAFWEHLRPDFVARFGRDPDSVLIHLRPREQSRDSIATLTAYWAHRLPSTWTSHLRITSVGGLVLVTTMVRDPCVTTIPWERCPRARR